eukprot:6874486-Pyramimonas_sp.AAC.1
MAARRQPPFHDRQGSNLARKDTCAVALQSGGGVDRAVAAHRELAHKRQTEPDIVYQRHPPRP